MPMELDRRELKARAKARMAAVHPSFWLITLVYLLLTTGLTTAGDLSGAVYLPLTPGPGDTVPLFLAVLLVLFTAVMDFGYRNWALLIYREEQPDLGALIDGFSMTGRVILLEVNLFLCRVGWSLLWAIPLGLVGGIAASFLPIPLVFLMVYAAVPLISLWISYRYALAPYLLMDHPEGGPFAAVRESVAMMRGWKWQLFRLDLTFLGWFAAKFLLSLGVEVAFAYPVFVSLLQAETLDPTLLITGLTLPWTATLFSTLIQVPISLWLTPYRTVSYAGFYQALVERPAPPPPVWGPYDGPYDNPEL